MGGIDFLGSHDMEIGGSFRVELEKVNFLTHQIDGAVSLGEKLLLQSGWALAAQRSFTW